MSNGIVYDPLLVRYLSDELKRSLGGRACAAAAVLAADLSATLPLDRGEALRFDLHPTRGWIRIVPYPADVELDSRIDDVSAPPDERLLALRLRAPDRFGAADRRLVVELHTNQWNAVLVGEPDQRIVSVLRTREAGGRVLRTGAAYEPPPPPGRFGAGRVEEGAAWERWETEIGGAAPGDRRGRLLGGFAYTGSVNAEPILGDSAREADPGELRAAFERWWALRALPPPNPVLLRTGRRTIPYPVPLPGLEGRPVDGLLAGMSEVAEDDVSAPAREPAAAELASAARARLAGLRRRVERLEEELARAGEAERLRMRGDLLLANLHRVRRGAAEIELTGWEGEPVTVPLDPALSPAENAERWYAEARKRARADERIPALLEKARLETERWSAAVEALERTGEAPGWLERELEEPAPGAAAAASDAETRPYRAYRTSGGLEVRVGRSARSNDRLTFGFSSPNDVWLHARSVGGSHVILRWPDPTGAPPARDLEEAASLAARYSKARTSGIVAVDWLRRKHVRKPRGAPPGAVTIQRARTVFVEPASDEMEETLRKD